MVKAKYKKNEKLKRHTNRLLWPGIALAIVAFLIIGSIWLTDVNQAEHPLTLKAAIIDQLYTNYPNQALTKEITRYLEDYGFQVDVYQGDDVTVDFYRGLAKLNYSLLIIRSHSGAMGYDTNPKGTIGTYLFTTESYSTLKYPKEQINNEIAMASVEPDQPRFFAIGPKFVTDSMKGRFSHTIIIIDGCSGLYSSDLAQAFIDEGASAYIAFDESVSLNHADEVTVSLIKNLCSAGSTVAKAVDNSMREAGPDPNGHAMLRYYPHDIGDSGMGELTQSR